MHGAPNHFEINVVGSRKYACWKFLEADQIEVGVGTQRRWIPRQRSDIGSGHWAYHGMGWIEGYIEIIYQAVRELDGQEADYPALAQNLEVMTLLLSGLERSWCQTTRTTRPLPGRLFELLHYVAGKR